MPNKKSGYIAGPSVFQVYPKESLKSNVGRQAESRPKGKSSSAKV